MSVAEVSGPFTMLSLIPEKKDSSNDSMVVGEAIQAIFRPEMRVNIGRPLTDQESAQFTASFITSIKENSIDLRQFFPVDKIEEGRRLLQEFASRYEAEKAESKRQREADLRELAKLESEIAECRLIIEDSDRKMAEADRKIAALDEKIARADEKIVRADDKIAKEGDNIARLDEKIAASEIVISEQKERRPIILAGDFYAIFKKDKLSEESASAIFNAYLSSGDLITAEDTQRKPFSQINSMNAVTAYFTHNPTIKAFDFRHFKTAITDQAIIELVAFLKTSAGLSIKGVAFKKAIFASLKSETKALLESVQAAPERAGHPLKVQLSD